MIPIRLPWRHRARPSATLHEIQPAPKGKLVHLMLHSETGFVNRNSAAAQFAGFSHYQKFAGSVREATWGEPPSALRSRKARRPSISSPGDESILDFSSTNHGKRRNSFRQDYSSSD